MKSLTNEWLYNKINKIGRLEPRSKELLQIKPYSVSRWFYSRCRKIIITIIVTFPGCFNFGWILDFMGGKRPFYQPCHFSRFEFGRFLDFMGGMAQGFKVGKLVWSVFVEAPKNIFKIWKKWGRFDNDFYGSVQS